MSDRLDLELGDPGPGADGCLMIECLAAVIVVVGLLAWAFARLVIPVFWAG